MKKKETVWQLLKRLDEQGGQFNVHLAVANRYFDIIAGVTVQLIAKHERDMQNLLPKIVRGLKRWLPKK